MNVKPLGDRILAKRVAEDEKIGSIIIPDAAKQKPQKAEVLAVGPGAKDENGKRIPIDVQVGDIVLFTQWAGNEIKVDGNDYLILKESDVIGVLEENSAKKKAA